MAGTLHQAAPHNWLSHGTNDGETRLPGPGHSLAFVTVIFPLCSHTQNTITKSVQDFTVSVLSSDIVLLEPPNKIP